MSKRKNWKGSFKSDLVRFHAVGASLRERLDKRGFHGALTQAEFEACVAESGPRICKELMPLVREFLALGEGLLDALVVSE